MLKIDCRNGCRTTRNEVREISDDLDGLYDFISDYTGVNASTSELMATLLSEVQKKINLLAEKIGCSFEVVPEVPSQPEKIVLVANKKTKKRK